VNPRRVRSLTAAGLTVFLGSSSAFSREIALTFDGGLRSMSNSPDTEKAIFDTKFGLGFGLGLSYDLDPRLRVGVEGRQIRREGERAFAADRNSPAFRLGHPLHLSLTEGLLTAEFRFPKLGPVTPYFGVGAGTVSWREESNIAGLVEKDSGTTGLFEGRVGVERRQGPLRLALEGGISLARHAVGAGGISQVYAEHDLGGLFVVGKIGLSRK
jgi:opacity protein-like surface antigen